MWPDNEDQLLQSDSHIDIPMWAMVPEPLDTMIVSDGENRSISEPPEEMMLIDDLWAAGIPGFDPMSEQGPTNPPFDDPTPYRPSNRTAPSNTLVLRVIIMLEAILRPPQLSGRGLLRAKLNYNLRSRIEDMLAVLWLFISHKQWIDALSSLVVVGVALVS